MKVLYATSECWPFSKTGGLGDVSYALPKALKKEGVDIRVILPKYHFMPNYFLDKLKKISEFSVDVGWRKQYCGLLELEYDGIKFYFIDNEYYFKRNGENSSYIYGFGDDSERYTFFSLAILESISRIEFMPDVININDWHTGMLPLLKKEHYYNYNNIKTIYTIHNLKYQGLFSKDIIGDILDININYYDNKDIEYYGMVNFMKAGIVFSDVVTTVSNTYKEEIQTPFYGEGLDGLLRSVNYKLKGILNGIDYELNDPKTDKNIFANYDVDDFSNKFENKLKLQETMGLEVNKDIPLIGIVSRLVSQKGFDLIGYMLPQLLNEDVQIVVLGTGEQKYQSMFNYYTVNNPKKVCAITNFDLSLAQKIYAGSDFFLMPSLFEPCGIGQMIAMRYGSIPIVRETGGLYDTIEPYNEYTNCGNGFSFRNYNAHEMFDTIKYALNIYKDEERFENIIKNAMNTDSSWKKSALEYKKLYEDIVRG